MSHIAIIQGTSDWLKARTGKFTASELYKLFTSGRKKDELFGGTAKSYIYEKAAEIMSDGVCLEQQFIESPATKWGKDYEPEARHVFEETTHLNVQTCGFFEYNEFFGGSPDGLVTEDAIVEIKCPYQAKHHVEHLCLKDAADLKTLRQEYYLQIQGNLLASNRTKAYFISYDPRFYGSYQIKILTIPRDEGLIQEAITRLSSAATLLQEILRAAMHIALT